MKKSLLLLSLFTIFGLTSLKADHVMGADMGYQCLGNGKYKIIVKFYRDCRGAGAPPGWSILGWYSGTNGGNACGGGGLSGLTRTGIRDITPKCSTANKPCNPVNTDYTGEGVEEHTYEVTIDITKAPFAGVVGKSSCCELTIWYNQCCRNAAITTGATWQNFYTTCMINVCNLSKCKEKCNTSTNLTNVPIAYACCNQAYYFNNGALDTTDYDSLSYAMAPALQGLPNSSVTYTTPFSYQYPVTPYCVPNNTIKCKPNLKTDPPRGFYMDTSTGDIVFTPTKCDEVSILVLEITEWRQDTTKKWVIVGKTRRDMQIIVKDDCGYNNAPKVDGPYNNKVCEGDKICFDIKGTDETFAPNQTVPDTVLMSWNQGIPGATFKIKNPTDREKVGEFCWQTKVGQASDVAYSFTVTANDQHCPKPTQSTRGFKVKVNPRAFDTRKYTILKCGRFAYEAKIPANFKGIAQYKWSFRDSNGNNEFYFSSKATDTMTFYKGGKFIIVHTINNSNNCPTIYRDTVVIPDPPKAILATTDTFACFKTSISLNATVLFAKAPYKYYWTRPDNHIPGDTLSAITLASVDRDSTIQLRVTDGDGCKFYDTATIFMKPLPAVPSIPDQRICTYQTATFDALHADTMFYNWSSGDTTRTITKNIAGDYIVKITDTIWGCQMKDTVSLFVNDTATALAGFDKAICTKDNFTIVASHRNIAHSAVYQWKDISAGTILGANTSYSVSPKNTNPAGGAPQFFSYELFAKVTQGGVTCEDYDTMTIRVNTLPDVRWTKNPLDPRCHDFGNITLNPFVAAPIAGLRKSGNFRIWGTTTGYGFKSGNNNNGIIDSQLADRHVFTTTKINNNTTLSGGKFLEDNLTVWFKDTNGCVNTASTRQRINGNPVIVLDTSIYCQDKGWAKLDSSVIRPKVKFGTKQLWEVLQVPSGVNPSNVLVDKSFGSGTDWELQFGNVTEDFYSGNYVLKFSVTDAVTSCFAVDTTMVKIIPEPTVKVTPPPPACLNWDTMDLRNNILLNGSKPVINSNNKFSIQEYRYDRNDPKVASTKLDKGYLFAPSSGAGAWLIKFSSDETGCLKEDSFYIFVNDTPSTTLLSPITLCSSGPDLDLDTRASNVQPSSAVLSWSGQNVTGRFFKPLSTGTSTLEGPYSLQLLLTDNNGCLGHYNYPVTVRSQPTVSITSPKPMQGCVGTPFDVKSTSKFTNGIVWTKINGAEGTISNVNSPDMTYQDGGNDTINKYAWVKVTSLPIANEVCPQVSDSVQMLLFLYPQVDMKDPASGCVPLTADFMGFEKRGIASTDLTWAWDFGNGQTSTDQNPTGISFPTQGKYTVTLVVTNTQGPCPSNMISVDYVNAYPLPVADFLTDPPVSTTVALPKFKMENRSTLDKSVFTNGSMKYHWDFDDPVTDPNDTSTLQNPKFSYGKDTNYYDITLTVTSDQGCVSTATKTVFVGPDIIVYIPDIFTPDGAGPNRNNTFMVAIQNYKEMEMMIYNRWGEKLFETTDINKGWDGTSKGAQCQDGVYVYKVNVTSFDGKVFNFDGTVTLIR